MIENEIFIESLSARKRFFFLFFCCCWYKMATGILRTTTLQSEITICSFQNMTSPGRLLATYPLLPSFQYCEALDCYVDRLDLLDEDIPPPHPPPTKKSEIFSLEEYADVDERAINVRTSVSFGCCTTKYSSIL